MRRLLVAVAAGLTVVALAGAVGLPDLAGAQDAPAAEPDTVTVTGVGSVESVPDEARMSFGVESRAETARAAVAANADAMRKVINALRQAGAREIATQWVSVYPVTGETGAVQGFAASNSVSAVADVADAPAVIDAAAGAGANQISGPGLSRSDADRLYRDALAKAVEDARARAEALARAAGRSLGAITSMVEGGGAGPVPYADRAAVESATPIEPGKLETSASVSVTFSLR
ncbi:MAG TPA: SIMPL domain-containing protein [Gaiellaceae bacterium]|nr:SIMPL domain-containing protein [Gaiellaceae bacterium]